MLDLKAKTLLHDILVAGTRIQTFCDRHDFEAYETNEMLKAAVERQFEIIGEALNKLSHTHQTLAESIT